MAKKRSKQHLNAIQPGFKLHWYEIRDIIGQGGFGITYMAYDRNLDHEVAIKEYMPVDLATRAVDGSVRPIAEQFEERYNWGQERFIEEARTIGQFKHPNLVRVRNVFEANNTAYMVMDYELGESLQEILSRRKILGEEDVSTVIFPITDGMRMVHAHGFIHRDIKPANIFIRVDGEPVLLDFGSARQALEESKANMTSLFSKGYAPIEQYNSQDEQGPWTDIYALGATMYRCIAGVPPSDAVDRSSAISLAGRDTYVSALEVGAGRYSRALLESIDFAMQFRRQDRPQTITEWMGFLHDHKDTKVPEPEAEKSAAPGEAAAESGATEDRWDTVEQPGRQPAGDDAAREQESERGVLAELESRANAGDAEAQTELAYAYAKGINADKDEAMAVEWYRRAAEQGLAAAQFNLGIMYAKGRGVERDYREAFRWYLKAADQGHVAAQSTVANMYHKGVGVDHDAHAAFDWSVRAAKRGHANSMFAVAEMYSRGEGVQENPAEAFHWYEKAARKGHIDAQVNLAFMYGKGQGVTRDDAEAFNWYRQAAESGNPIAQFNLGVIYAKGRGIPRDIEQATRWYRASADQGNPNAERALEKLATH